MTVPCPKCAHHFENTDAFLKHFHFMHMFNCLDCDATFDNTTSLENHKALIHLNKVPELGPIPAQISQEAKLLILASPPYLQHISLQNKRRHKPERGRLCIFVVNVQLFGE
jgi:hypothetical protein